MSKTKKLKRATAKKQTYLKTYEARIKRGDRNTPTYAQWLTASPTERGMMQAGVGQAKIKRLKRKR